MNKFSGPHLMSFQVLVLLATFAVAISAHGELPQEKDLLCDICQDIVGIVFKTIFHKLENSLL